jgi:hypothetical protein
MRMRQKQLSVIPAKAGIQPSSQELPHRWGARCEVRKKMAAESPLGRGRGRQALGWVVERKRTHPGASRPLSLRVTPPERGSSSEAHDSRFRGNDGDFADPTVAFNCTHPRERAPGTTQRLAGSLALPLIGCAVRVPRAWHASQDCSSSQNRQ